MIIAFGNKARQGKDTCCEVIMKHFYQKAEVLRKHGRRVHDVPHVLRINFADALRIEVTEATEQAGSTEALIQQMNCPSWVVVEPNPVVEPLLRFGKHPKLLQWWGTEYRRSQDADYWVKRWLNAALKHKGIVVTSDMRFLNEGKAVRDAGGYSVNVSRMNADGSAYFDTSRPPDHPSETELDGYSWDFYLKAVTGQTALLEQYVVTLSEYIWGMEK